MPVKTREELLDLYNSGWRIYKDSSGYLMHDPISNRNIRISVSLNDLAEELYEKQKEEKKMKMLNEALEEDMKFILSTVRQRLDPKAPIITKWTENVSWWTHVFLDFSALVSPYILSLLTPNEIDLSNPEVTVKNMVGKFEALREKATRASEIEAKLRSENEALKQILREYERLIDEQNKLIAETLSKARETINFFMIVLPKQLPEELKQTYIAYSRKLKEVWGV
jgi:lipopolysaccharide biosynthesis regulator YciM